MKDIIHIINEIIKYGLEPGLNVVDKEKLLEKNLITIYSYYFDVEDKFDKSDFPEFKKPELDDIRINVESNFKDFGFYCKVLAPLEIDEEVDISLGDTIDDLSDIIIDLLEIKWRIENNSLTDGLWFFDLTFYNHTQQHILDLLNYMKQKNG